MERSTRKCIGLLAFIWILILTQPAMALPQGVLEIGDYGSQVAELQQELSDGLITGEDQRDLFHGYPRCAIALQKWAGVEVDGAYGPETASAYVASLADGILVKPRRPRGYRPLGWQNYRYRSWSPNR